MQHVHHPIWKACGDGRYERKLDECESVAIAL